MKKFTYFFLATALIAAISCQEEVAPEFTEEPAPQQEQSQTLTNPVTLTFTADALTKVSINEVGTGDKAATWDENDQIKIVWYAGGSMGSTTATATTYGTSSTTFTATVEDAEDYYAVYPSSLDVSLDGDGNFNVTFAQNAACPTSFKDAAYYAAKTTKAAKDFAFHPISTIIKFQVEDTEATSIYCRTLNQGLTYLRGDVPVIFDGSFNTTVGKPAEKMANVTVTVSGANTYYLPLPASGETASDANDKHSDGFLLRIQKGSSWVPAAFWTIAITLTPGKMYSLKTSVDDKAYTEYYVSPTADGTGDGRTAAKPLTMAQLAAMVPFHDETQAAANILDGATVYLLGDNSNAYTTAIPASTGTIAHNYSIVGGSNSETTTITTTASTTFNNAKATVTMENITFSGCTTKPAMSLTAGKINITGCTFSSNSCANGAALSIGNSTSTDADLNAHFTDCLFSANQTTAEGAVILVPNASQGGIATFNNCLFLNNKLNASAKSGAIAYTSNGKTALFFNNCSFTGNAATGSNTISNGMLFYLNNANARLGMNNCTINAGSGYHNNNTAVVTNKGYTVIANSTLWSKDGIGTWGMIALGSASQANGSTVINSIVRNNTNSYEGFHFHANYYQNVKWCLYTGGDVADAGKNIVSDSYNAGAGNGTFVTGASYKNTAINGITQYYYTHTTDLAALFSKPTKAQVENAIAKTGESADDAKDGMGATFLAWLNTVDGLTKDIKGSDRPEGGLNPGSCE